MLLTMHSENPFRSLASDQLQVHILQSGACLCNELDAPPSSADCIHNVRILLFGITYSEDQFVAVNHFEIARPDFLHCRQDRLTDTLKLDHGPPSAHRSLEF